MSMAHAKVSGPVEGGKGWPYAAPPAHEMPASYMLEEFMIEGTARSYRPAADAGVNGRWDVEPDEQAAYVSRMYVVRPRVAEHFNGVVLVNWQNVTAGADIGVPPPEAYTGAAWVGVSAQYVGIHGHADQGDGRAATVGLPAEDPERYARLSHPGDAFCYDIFTQAARAVSPARSVDSVDALGGLEPMTMLAAGASQSAMRLGSYINMVQPREELFDGFLLTVHFGVSPRPPNEFVFGDVSRADGALRAMSARIRDDLTVPVLIVNSEGETMSMYPVRQPDTESFRLWEIAGTAHATGGGLDVLIERVGEEMFASLGVQPNTVRWDYVADAALRHLVAWVRDGVAPPRFEPIEVEGRDPPRIRRSDDDGNAIGGLRVPELAAPTARHRGGNDGIPMLGLLGESVPYSESKLHARYADRAAYLAAWDAGIDALLATGLDISGDVELLRTRGRKLAGELPLD
jgi:hypothetical protein